MSPAKTSGRALAISLLILIQVVFFAPILTTGLLQDDLVLSVLDYKKPDTFQEIATSTGDWIGKWLETGRFLPVAPILSTPLFHFFDFNHAFGYHLLQVVLIVACGVYFAMRFVPEGVPRIAAVLLLCTMSANYSIYHDPYLSYHLVMPVFTLFFLGAAAWFARHLEDGGVRAGLLALLFYGLTIITYEISYPLILVFVVQLLWLRPGQKRTWMALALLAIAMAGLQVWLRKQASGIAYDGISVSLAPRDVVRTFVMQAFSSVPFAPQAGGLLRRLGGGGGGLLTAAMAAGGFAVLVAASVWLGIRFLRDRSRDNALLVIGMIVWLAPALVTSVSAKYQTELQWGLGYIPRYLQNFGLALVVLGFAGRWLATRRGIAVLAVFTIAAFALNLRTIRSVNRESAAARLLFNLVADHRFLKDSDCGHLFVTHRFLHSFDQFRALNPDVDVHGGEEPQEGDHVLLIHFGDPGSEWAVFGEYREGQVRNARLLLGKRHAAQQATGRVADWSITPLSAPQLDYRQLRADVAANRIPMS